jgi:predicted phage-related endonuclease
MLTRIDLTQLSREQWLALRRDDVTASDVGALFGCHPYRTMRGLYEEKSGEPLPDLDSPVLRRGRLLEDAVAVACMEARPDLKIEKAGEYIRDPALRLGATPDFYVSRISSEPVGELGVMQAKTVSPFVFKREWTEELPPAHIVLQCLLEMMLTNRSFGIVAALEIADPHFPLHVYDIPRHPRTEAAIEEAAVEFWRRVREDDPPPMDYTRDGALIARLFAEEQAGKEIDLTLDNRIVELVDARDGLASAIRSATKERDAVEAEIKEKLGDAEIARCPGGRVITWKSQSRKETVIPASRFRVLRVNKPTMEQSHGKSTSSSD